MPKLDAWRFIDNADDAERDIRAHDIRRIWTEQYGRFLNPVQLDCWNNNLGWLIGGVGRRVARSMGIDDGVGWIPAAYRACRTLDSSQVDLILASGPPFATFFVAERLSRKLRRPYVLDYRDTWNTTPRQSWITRREQRLIRNSAGVTTVSPSLAGHLTQQFDMPSQVEVVTNGYDSQDYAAIKPTEFGHFAIVYAGIFYPPERVVTPVFEALKQSQQFMSGVEWYFHYYGDDTSHVREEAARYGLLDRVKLHGRVPRAVVLSALRGASVAVVITSVSERPSLTINSIPGKLFEAIALAPAVLLLTPGGSDAEQIGNAAGIVRCCTGSDLDAMRSFFQDLVGGWKPLLKSTEQLNWNHLGSQLNTKLRLWMQEAQSKPIDALPAR